MPGSGRGTLKSDSIGPFFETHVLGIMAQLSDTINDGKEPQPVSEKNRCLSAVRVMVLLAKNHISNGLPQVSLPFSEYIYLFILSILRRSAHVYVQPLKTVNCAIPHSRPG